MNTASKEKLYNNICSCAKRIRETRTRNGVKKTIENRSQLDVLLGRSTLRMLIWLDTLCTDTKKDITIGYRPHWDQLQDALDSSDMLGVAMSLKQIVAGSGAPNIPALTAGFLHWAARMAMLIHMKCTYNMRPVPRYTIIRKTVRLFRKITHR